MLRLQSSKHSPLIRLLPNKRSQQQSLLLVSSSVQKVLRGHSLTFTNKTNYYYSHTQKVYFTNTRINISSKNTNNNVNPTTQQCQPTALAVNNSNNHKINTPTLSKNSNKIPLSAAAYPIPKAFCIGTLAGFCGSLAGVGGGFIMIPLMTSNLLRIPQHAAHGTSLFAVAATGLAGALSYYNQSHYVDIESAIAIMSCAMITARIGAKTSTKLSGKALKRALGLFMICVAPLVPARTWIFQQQEERKRLLKEETQGNIEISKQNDCDLVSKDGLIPDNDQIPPYITEQELLKLLTAAGIGLGAGFISGLFGVGGGLISVPALTIFTDMNHYTALGTSLCSMSLPAIVGSVTHYRKGNFVMKIAPPLAMGCFVGASVGAYFAVGWCSEENLRYGFAGMMVTLGLKSLLRT